MAADCTSNLSSLDADLGRRVVVLSIGTSDQSGWTPKGVGFIIDNTRILTAAHVGVHLVDVPLKIAGPNGSGIAKTLPAGEYHVHKSGNYASTPVRATHDWATVRISPGFSLFDRYEHIQKPTDTVIGAKRLTVLRIEHGVVWRCDDQQPLSGRPVIKRGVVSHFVDDLKAGESGSPLFVSGADGKLILIGVHALTENAHPHGVNSKGAFQAAQIDSETLTHLNQGG